MNNEELTAKRIELQKFRYADKNRKKYEKRLETRILCNSCDCMVDPYYWKTHCETEKHKEHIKGQCNASKTITCEACAMTIKQNYLKRHLLTEKHKYFESLSK